MIRQLVRTEDGSNTLYVPEIDEHYHSIHGAIQESMHVFIRAGLNAHPGKKLTVFEVGFGTGLNAWLTALECEQQQHRVSYYAIEKFPLCEKEWKNLLPEKVINDADKQLFLSLHEAKWENPVDITSTFQLYKIKNDLTSFDLQSLPNFDLIYFDAFAPDKQPAMWSPEIFEAISRQTLQSGILVTYSAKGAIRRTMQKAGFQVERIPGPPGKREMLRGRKP